MSDSTAKRLPSLMRPIAIPATCALTGTPASISARLPPQTEAIDEEPLDSVISETTRIERRSEEHTSELQSLAYLVCRLLLEKKKKKRTELTENRPKPQQNPEDRDRRR